MEKENDMMRYTRSFLGLLIFLAISAEGLAGIWTTNEFIYKPGQGARGESEKSTYDSGQDRVDVRLAKEVWVGDPKFGATLQDALTALGATTAVLRVPKGTCNIDANLTIPSNITLKPERGAILAIATAKTLTINGGLEAGLYQVFSCTGTGKVVFAAGSNQTIVPQWWGASPSASAAVNTAAIQASFTALADYTSWTLPPGTYACNASLVIGSYDTALYGLTMDFKGYLTFDACSGLDIRYVRRSDIRGIKVERPTIDWSANNFGVKFGKCSRSNIELQIIRNFTYGFYIDGGTGINNAYLTFNLGYFAENKYHQYVTNNGGWNTENSYYGGQFTSNRRHNFPFSAVSIADDTITFVDTLQSCFATGAEIYVEGAYTLAAPLVQGTTYYLIRVDDHTVKLATSYANAIAGTAIDLTTQGASGYTGSMGIAGSYAVYLNATPGQYPFENYRWYNTSIESLHNGFYFAGYASSNQMFLSHPRFEAVANWIEKAPKHLTWIQGMQPIGRIEMTMRCPRLYESTGKSIVTIIGSGYADLDSYLAYAAPKNVAGWTDPSLTGGGGGGLSFYNPLSFRQMTNLRSVVKDFFTIRQEDMIMDHGTTFGSDRWTISYPMNKGYQESAAPTAGIERPMTYAKNAVVWNTNVASGQPMGWVCSKSGSVVRAGSITGVGNVTGGSSTTEATLTITTRGSTYYFFVGAFLLINGVQHQIKAAVTPDTGAPPAPQAVYTLYTNNLGGDVTGAAIANDPPTWIPMVNLVSTVTTPAVPASTVEQRNTNAFPCRVAITGGTVTVIKKGPTSGSLITTGATTGAFILEPNEYIAITYSVAPTWAWLGM
jgi:hypothetical protein